MREIMWAILGGSGFEKFDQITIVSENEVNTPFGKPSAPIVRAKIGQHDILFLSRHGRKHEHTPSTLNYRANIFALKASGASKILSVSAVGSLQKELVPGDCVIPSQYIDRTKSIRCHTFCKEGIVGHVSLAHPVEPELIRQVKEILNPKDFSIHYDRTYVCIEGPGFSTKADAKVNRLMGADIVGMTNFPEYALAKEAGMCYFPLSFVTDFDCWDDNIEHVTLEQVLEIMHKNNHKAFDLISQIVPATSNLYPKGCPEAGLKTGLMTPMNLVPEADREWLEVICS
jgi:5'-methylthioadenosine phosphorylase